MSASFFAEGFVLGISSGATCAGSCAPFLLPYVLAEGETKQSKSILLLVRFLLGRFLAYLLFGIAAGWLGGHIKPHLSQAVQNGTLAVASLFMIAFAFSRTSRGRKICVWVVGTESKRRMPFVFGFLLGLNLCPPFLVGVARLAEIGNVWGGAIFFSAFFLATTIYIVPLFIVGPFLATERLRRVGIITSFLVGIWYLAVAALSSF